MSDNFIDEIQKLVDDDHIHRVHSRNLESELGVYKNAYATLEEDCRRLSREKFEYEKQAAELRGCGEEFMRQIEDLKLQLKVRRYYTWLSTAKFSLCRATASLFSLMAMAPFSRTNSLLKGRRVVILPQRSYQSQSPNTSHKSTAHINIKSEFTSS